MKYQYYFIYITKNLINQKSYIGWHATNKLNDGYLGSGKALKKAVLKYGAENFINQILEYCNEKEVFEKEIFWIKEKNTLTPNGYNLTIGGDGRVGLPLSDETKKKLSIAGKGKHHSEEAKKRMSESQKLSRLSGKNIGMTGKNHSNKTKEQMSQSRLGIIYTEETKEKMRLNAKGKSWEERYGKDIANEMRIKRNKNRKTCEYCHKSIAPNIYSKDHGQKCKAYQNNMNI